MEKMILSDEKRNRLINKISLFLYDMNDDDKNPDGRYSPCQYDANSKKILDMIINEL